MGPGAAGIPELQILFQRIVSLLVGIAFVAVVCMLVYASIRYLTSGGEQKGIKVASNTITWALLGIAFLVLIWIFLKLIESFTGVSITNFCIGFAPYCV